MSRQPDAEHAIVFATGNEHKKKEIGAILPGIPIELPGDYGIDFDIPEDGTTFFENARQKAGFLFDRLRRPVLADDSGLCVAALDGAPGIYSARYGSVPGGPRLAAADRNDYLLSKLEGIEDRRAAFVCCMVLIIDEYRFFAVQETVEGFIADAPSGGGGFGYDPVFYIPGLKKTMAELGEAEKNRISHRGRAGAGIMRILKGLKEDIHDSYHP